VAGAALYAGRQALTYAEDPAGDKSGPSILPTPTAGPPPARAAPVPGDAPADLRWAQRGGTIDDASWLDRTAVHGIVRVSQPQDVADALAYARARDLMVSTAGVRHSMGGHAFYHDAVVLDMTAFNRVTLDAANRLITVQSGATWHDIQEQIHPRFAVIAMQSTDIFTVGGSLSVNAHGMDHRAGAIADTVRWLRVMLPDGTVRLVSRAADPELFRLVVGGYGLFGVILEAQLEVTDNALYHSERRVVDYRTFPDLFERDILPDPKLGLFYGHLSTAPGSLLREMLLYTYRDAGPPPPDLPPLREVSQVKLRRLVINLSKQGGLFRSAKWFLERHVEPRLESCTVTRAQGLTSAEGCFVSRNEPMHDSVPYLRNNLRGETDILQEYFVPRARFVPFVDAARDILASQRANLLNASVRAVHREDVALNYAPEDMFALVLYVNQRTDDAGNRAMRTLTQSLIDATIGAGGRFFLPYQLHYTPAQLERSYPEIGAFFRAKRRYDPDHLLTNTWYETYAPHWP
jgi:FAD/FMN-containing dehydrogenase